MPERVFITGIGGFVGSHVAKSAAAAGLSVRGSVRNGSHDASLSSIIPGVELRVLDLNTSSEDEFTSAMQGCDYLAHVASPFPGGSVTSEEMKAAIEGTAKVLKAAKAAGIKKVVLTSSVAAISGNWPKDSKRGTSQAEAFNGGDWTKLEGLESTYAESKTRAERAAWDLSKAIGVQLSTVHPSFVQGPMLLPRAPTSTALVKRILEGSMPAVPPIGMNVCSVTDVADTHVAALLGGEASVGQRYLVTSGNVLMTDLAKKVKFAYSTWPVKTLEAPWILMKLYSCFDAQAATVMSSWRKETYYDSAPTAALLSRELADPYDACLEMAKSLVDQGIATK